MRNPLAIVALVALAACQPSQEFTDDQELALVDSVLQVHGGLIAAARAVDADRLLAFFAADAGVVMDGVVVPRDRFATNVRAAYQQLDRQEVDWHPARVSVISRDAVVLTIGGRYRAISPTGETVWDGEVAWTEVFERQPDGWKLTHAHQSRVPPATSN